MIRLVFMVASLVLIFAGGWSAWNVDDTWRTVAVMAIVGASNVLGYLEKGLLSRPSGIARGEVLDRRIKRRAWWTLWIWVSESDAAFRARVADTWREPYQPFSNRKG